MACKRVCVSLDGTGMGVAVLLCVSSQIVVPVRGWDWQCEGGLCVTHDVPQSVMAVVVQRSTANGLMCSNADRVTRWNCRSQIC